MKNTNTIRILLLVMLFGGLTTCSKDDESDRHMTNFAVMPQITKDSIQLKNTSHHNLNIDDSISIIPHFPGKGTAEEPYLISTADELDNVALIVNKTTRYHRAHYRLIANINLKDRIWLPIGDGNPFSGTFDGNGKTIYGFSNTGYNHIGFFSCIDTLGIVKNLHIIGTEITATKTFDGYAGGIAGTNYGKILGCTFQGSVNGAYAGGIVGYNSGKILGCTFQGYVSGANMGGIIGFNRGHIIACITCNTIIKNFNNSSDQINNTIEDDINSDYVTYSSIASLNTTEAIAYLNTDSAVQGFQWTASAEPNTYPIINLIEQEEN